MIVDTLANIGRYASLGQNFATAARFLLHTDLTALPLGVTEVDGQKVYVNLADNCLDRADMAWEAHDRYADIQLILKGRERFGWSSTAVPGPLEGDFRACAGEKDFDFTLAENQFVIFLPGEPHSPGNPDGAPALCRKLVVKVLVNE